MLLETSLAVNRRINLFQKRPTLSGYLLREDEFDVHCVWDDFLEVQGDRLLTEECEREMCRDPARSRGSRSTFMQTRCDRCDG